MLTLHQLLVFWRGSVDVCEWCAREHVNAYLVSPSGAWSDDSALEAEPRTVQACACGLQLRLRLSQVHFLLYTCL